MDIERWEQKSITRKRLRRALKYVRFSWMWFLVIVLVASLTATAWALRQNNLEMIELRNQVVWADEYGTTLQLEEALRDLQRFVGRHMNTSMGDIGIALQHTYNRDVQTAVKKAAEAQTINIPAELLAQYDAECAPYLEAGEWQYVNCISTRINYTGENLDFSAPEMPNPDLYYVNFTPPRLSLDLAGLLVIIDFILLLIIVLAIVFNIILRVAIKILYRTS